MNNSRRKRMLVITAGAAALLATLLVSAPAQAIPAFARKYANGCTMCHSGFPRLNDFGTRFRFNGYRRPGEENKERTVLETPPPIAARANAGFELARFRDTPGAENHSRFLVSGLDVLAAGLLRENAGFLMVYTPPLPTARGFTGQDAALEMGNVVFSSLAGRWLNVRAGRFEPAYAAFSDKRRLSFAPYLPYETAFPGGPPLSETQEGIEVTGYQFSGFSYAAGWVNGSSTNRLSDLSSQAYARAAYVIGRGEGQTRGQRLGLTVVWGEARPEGQPEAARRQYLRLGVDASLNLGAFNLALQYLWSRDDRTLWGLETTPQTNSGMAELDWFPATWLTAFARFDLADTPEEIHQDAWQAVVGARWYVEMNLAIHAEYAHRSQQHGAGTTWGREDVGSLLVDWAF